MKTTDKIFELIKEMIIVSTGLNDEDFECWKLESLKAVEDQKTKERLQQIIGIVEKYRKRVLS